MGVHWVSGLRDLTFRLQRFDTFEVPGCRILGFRASGVQVEVPYLETDTWGVAGFGFEGFRV